MSETTLVSKKKKKPTGPFLHIDNLEWLLKDFIEDDRWSWVFEKQNKPYLKGGGIALLCAYLIIGPGAQLISNLVGFLYPAYCSIKALETHNKADDSRWLTYWVVFASFCLLDTFSGFLLSWIPFYWLAKVIFLFWCFSPSDFNGADVIYKHVILPFFKKHEHKIDQHMDKFGNVIKKVADKTEDIIQTEEIKL